MKIYMFLTSLCFVLLVSCNSSKTNRIDFGDATVKNTFASSTKTLDIFLGMPISLEHISNSLIIREPHARTHFTMLDLESGKLYEFGNKGKGPHEMLQPVSFADKDQLEFNSYCLNSQKIIIYNTDSLKKSIDDPSRAINNLNKFSGLIFEIESAKNNTFIARGQSFESSNTYFLLDESFKIIGQGGEYPENAMFTGLEDLSKCLIFQGQMVFNKEFEKGLLFFYKCIGYEAFTIESNDIKLRKQILESMPEYNVSATNPGDVMYSKENKSGFLCSSNTDNYAYALFSGKSYFDANESMMNQIHGDKIYKFNWDGELISIINLDKNINVFTCVNDSVFYGINSEDEPYLLKFSVNE